MTARCPGCLDEGVPTYAVTYTYTDDAALRDEHRPVHRAFLASLLDAGTLLASGPLAAVTGPDGARSDGALLLLRGDDDGAVLATLDADPFLAVGAIAARDVRGWDPVIGPFAG